MGVKISLILGRLTEPEGPWTRGEVGQFRLTVVTWVASGWYARSVADREDGAREEGRRGSEIASEGRLSKFAMPRGRSLLVNRRNLDSDDPDEATVDAIRVRVTDGEVERPFMRGILVHSLTAQGIGFEEAYGVAQSVWKRVRDRTVVEKKELLALIEEFSSPVGGPDPESSRPERDTPLDVQGKDGRWPFSQGRLQQSLLAAGLPPLDTFEAAVEIERVLRDKGQRVILRDTIRDLAGTILRQRAGPESAARFLAWRAFQAEDARPLILLLGGTTGVGKSSLALEVARRLAIGRVLSTDSVRDVMRVMLSEDLMPTLHVSSFEAHTRVSAGIHEGLDPLLEGYLDQARAVLVGVRAVIERAIAEGTSTVLDGVSLVPGLFDPDEWRGRAHVFFLLAADEDRDSLRGHLLARAHGRGARASERYVMNLSEIFQIQEDLLDRARMASVPIVDVHDRDAAARRVVRHVVGLLAQQRAAEAARLD